VALFVDLPRTAFVHGELRARVRVMHDASAAGGAFSKVMDLTLFGPDGGTPR
jgi:hypothetical protein